VWHRYFCVKTFCRVLICPAVGGGAAAMRFSLQNHFYCLAFIQITKMIRKDQASDIRELYEDNERVHEQLRYFNRMEEKKDGRTLERCKNLGAEIAFGSWTGKCSDTDIHRNFPALVLGPGGKVGYSGGGL
jgi:hypothetical protein